MTPERWQQIDKLLEAALEYAPNERAAFLVEACAGDEALRKNVEVLLAAHEQAATFIETPALEMTAQTLAQQVRSMVGRQLGPYQILALLGKGGMGEVYCAEDARLGRKIALKLLPEQFTQDAERVRRFEREARAASATSHPNIITIYEIGQDNDCYFIATEYVDGETLQQRFAGQPMRLREVLDVAIQVVSALVAAHEAGITHRDIKPENIMLRRDGIVKVLDFGLAKLTELRNADCGMRNEGDLNNPQSAIRIPHSTAPGTVMGTPQYMSPEQVTGHDVDARSDLFSFGVVLYQMIAGHPPFEGAVVNELLAAILNHEPPPLQRYAREVPAELERIVSKALAKDRAERYQGARDLLIDLKNLRLEMELDAKLKRLAQGETRTDIRPSDLPPSGESARTTLIAPPRTPAKKLEPVGGAVPLQSAYYIVRSTDIEFHDALAQRDSIVLVKGPRQAGKTSLLARGLQQSRETGACVVLTDFQDLSAAWLESLEKLLLTLAESFAVQLELRLLPGEMWNAQLSPGVNFELYLRRAVFPQVAGHLIWGMDEVDRLFGCAFGSEVFGLFRSWHNKRALDPSGAWDRFTLAIAYATEAHLFITDLNQSPFNVGTRLQLEDFSFEQVAELNRRYGAPLRDPAEVARYFRLVGGHPYLVRRGLHELATQGLGLGELEARADGDEGAFGDHLRRLFVSLAQDAALCEVMRGVLQGHPCPISDSFYRLRSAGVLVGDSPRDVRPRCQLYATYLEKHLL
jgi:serine/threonine protein kinase